MTQAEVVKIFEKNPNSWFAAKEIAEKTKLSEGSVRANLRRLAKSKTLLIKQERRTVFKHRFYLYKLNTT